MKKALIAIGGNLVPDGYDDISQVMADAMADIKARGLQVQATSRWYETEPVPVSDQPWFLNAVVEIETDLSAHDLLALLHDIEANFGRVRHQRNEARILDLDVIDYDNQVIDDGVICLPHPRMHLRAFVLCPLSDINPDWQHPQFGKIVARLIEEMPSGQNIRLKA